MLGSGEDKAKPQVAGWDLSLKGLTKLPDLIKDGAWVEERAMLQAQFKDDGKESL